MKNQNTTLFWILIVIVFAAVSYIFISVEPGQKGVINQHNLSACLFLIPICLSIIFLDGLETMFVSIASFVFPVYIVTMPQFLAIPYSKWPAGKTIYEYLLYLCRPALDNGLIWQLLVIFILSFWIGFYSFWLKRKIAKSEDGFLALQASYEKLENEKTQVLYQQERYGRDINSLGSLLITLSELAKEIPSVMEIDSLFRLVMDKTMELLSAASCAVFYIDDVSGRLVYACSTGYDEKELVGLSLTANEESGMVGWCAKYGKFLSMAEAEQDPHMTDILRQNKFPIFACQPIVERGKSIAVICIGEIQKEFKGSEVMRLTSLLASLSSISIENAQLMKKTKEQAIRDGLTGLYNHRHFYECLDEQMRLAESKKLVLGICLIDIDYFKTFNDTYGHLVGDLILQDAAKIIQNQIQKDDISARYGGEEFAVICLRNDSTAINILAEQLRRAIEQTVFKSGDLRLNVTISIGVAYYDIKIKSAASVLVKYSDDALYKAKETGRNKVCIYGK